VQLVFLRYAIERLLYRLSVSNHHDRFILKGAMLFAQWAPTPHRPSGDLDLLGLGDSAPDVVRDIFREVVAELGVPMGEMVHPVRVALTGKSVGPGLFETMSILGKEKTVQRLKETFK